jgi:hypothetical protein
VFITVGTPPRADGSADTRAIYDVAKTVAQNLDGYKLIVQKSTRPSARRATSRATSPSRRARRGVRRRVEPGVPARGLGDRDVHAARSRRHRRREREAPSASCANIHARCS